MAPVLKGGHWTDSCIDSHYKRRPLHSRPWMNCMPCHAPRQAPTCHPSTGRALLSAHTMLMLMLDHFPAGRTVNSPSDGWMDGRRGKMDGGWPCSGVSVAVRCNTLLALHECCCVARGRRRSWTEGEGAGIKA